MAAPLFQNPRALANDGPRIRAATTDDSLNSCPVTRRAVGVDSAHPTDLTLLNQTSELPPETDINTAGRHVSKVPTCDISMLFNRLASLRGQDPVRADLREEPAAQLAGKLLAGNCGRSAAADKTK